MLCLDQTVDVDQRHKETRVMTSRVLVYATNIVVDIDFRRVARVK